MKQRLFLCAAVSCAAVLCSSMAYGTLFTDITTSPTAEVNGAIYEVYDFKTAGSGAVNSFLRLHGNGQNTVEQGYNTGDPRGTFPGGFPDFQQKKGNFTYNIQLGDIPKVTEDGIDYRQILLDLNENNSMDGSNITLERFQVFVGDDSNVFLNGDETLLVDNGPLGKKVYDLDDNGNPMPDDNAVLMADMFSGSGSTDVRILIPEEKFAGLDAVSYFTVFAEFSDFDAGGFEEFVAGGRGGGPGPGGDPGPIAQVPEPASLALWLLSAGVCGLFVWRVRRRNRATTSQA